MKIYTSYHAKAEQLIENGLTLISISVIYPWYSKIEYLSYPALAPGKAMLKMSKGEYDKRFDLILTNLNPKRVISDLTKISNGKDIALLCYEKDVNTCHRKKVGIWLENKLSITVKEIKFRDKKELINQLKLF